MSVSTEREPEEAEKQTRETPEGKEIEDMDMSSNDSAEGRRKWEQIGLL